MHRCSLLRSFVSISSSIELRHRRAIQCISIMICSTRRHHKYTAMLVRAPRSPKNSMVYFTIKINVVVSDSISFWHFDYSIFTLLLHIVMHTHSHFQFRRQLRIICCDLNQFYSQRKIYVRLASFERMRTRRRRLSDAQLNGTTNEIKINILLYTFWWSCALHSLN